MRTPPDAIVTRESSIDIDATPQSIYDMVSDVGRMGEWSPEAVGADWLDGGTGRRGDWFEGHNATPEREWSRRCQVAAADPGRDFTFVVGGIDDNCTWWSFEMDLLDDGGTRLTERWWIVNKTPAMQGATQEQFENRVAYTETMLTDTLAAIKATAEAN